MIGRGIGLMGLRRHGGAPATSSWLTWSDEGGAAVLLAWDDGSGSPVTLTWSVDE